jgi:hypothetical protein
MVAFLKHQKRLDQLQKKAAGGDIAAMNEARLLADWLSKASNLDDKKADDRCKIIAGAWMGCEIASKRPVVIENTQTLLAALDDFLVRPGERLALLGGDGQGSPAFWRVFG